MATIILGDIVEVIKETVHNPQESGFQYFVGLEHYDSGEPLITRYATPDNLTSSVKHFAKGDILVARRNVYLKRASLVDFEGVTSGDSIVLRAKDKKYQRILPFILNSDDFWDYAEQNSDGTMSKRLSPADLLDYEFEEPENIEVLADKLWAAYRVKESYKKLLAATDDMLKAKFIEMFGEEEKITLESIASSWSKGQSFSKNDIVDEGSTPCIHYGQLYKYGYVINKVFSATNASAKATSTRGDILFPASDVTPRGLARCSCIDLDGVILGGDIIVMHPIEGIDSIYLSYAINQQTNQLLQLVTGSVVRHMSAKSLKTVKVPLPPLPLQQQFVEIATQAEATKESLRKSIENIDQVIKSLINQ